MDWHIGRDRFVLSSASILKEAGIRQDTLNKSATRSVNLHPTEFGTLWSIVDGVCIAYTPSLYCLTRAASHATCPGKQDDNTLGHFLFGRNLAHLNN